MSSSDVTHVVDGASYHPAGKPATAVLIMVTITALAVCFTQRVMIISSWRKLTAVRWYILIIYVDSFLFVFSAGLISLGLGVNKSPSYCAAATIMCIVFYITTKAFIYLLLVEKVRLVNGAWLPRRKDKLYLFNTLGMLVPYAVVFFLALAYRFSYLDNNGACRIGAKTFTFILLVAFDVVVNVYLTTLFLIPVIKISRGRAQQSQQALRSMAVKTICGSCATLISSLANVMTLMILKSESGWVCLLLCSADILFSALVLHAITNKDHQGNSETTRATNRHNFKNNIAIRNATEAETRIFSIAKPHRQQSSVVATNTTSIGLGLDTIHENDIFHPLPEKPVSLNLTSERKGSKAWAFRGSSRNPSTSTEVHYDIEQTSEEQQEANVRPEGPIAEYAEYDFNKLDFITSAEIVADVFSNDEGSQHALSDEETVGRHERYEEQVPHKLV